MKSYSILGSWTNLILLSSRSSESKVVLEDIEVIFQTERATSNIPDTTAIVSTIRSIHRQKLQSEASFKKQHISQYPYPATLPINTCVKYLLQTYRLSKKSRQNSNKMKHINTTNSWKYLMHPWGSQLGQPVLP